MQVDQVIRDSVLWLWAQTLVQGPVRVRPPQPCIALPHAVPSARHDHLRQGEFQSRGCSQGSRFSPASDHTEETWEGAWCAGRLTPHPHCCAGRGWAHTCSRFLELINLL